ncbi:PQQ-like beta-propeller repeat protein [Thermostilla marina]
MFVLTCTVGLVAIGCAKPSGSEPAETRAEGDTATTAVDETTAADESVPQPAAEDQGAESSGASAESPAEPTEQPQATDEINPSEAAPSQPSAPVQQPASETNEEAEPAPAEPPVAEAMSAGEGTPASAANGYWPRFHGPNQDNISTETGLLDQWPEEGPPLLWTAEGIGEGFATVAIDQGRILTAGNIEEDMVVTCLDLEGNIVWQTKAGEAWTVNFPGSRGTPVIDGDRVYFEGPSGYLACLKLENGETIWSVNILDKFGGKVPKWALAESVLIDGNKVICTPGGPNTCVVALDKMTGEVVWQSESADGDEASYATPVLAEYQGLRMVITMTAKAVVGVDADTGHLLFRHPHETKYDVNAAMPIFHDGKVFVSTGYGAGSQLIKLTVDGKNVTVEQVWENKELDNHHGGVILYEGYLYGANFKQEWMCLDWETGETKYKERGVGKGSATLAEGLLYTFSENRKLGIVKATPEGHAVISQFEIPSGGSGKSWAHPVVCGKRLYIRHGNYLYVYDIAKK